VEVTEQSIWNMITTGRATGLNGHNRAVASATFGAGTEKTIASASLDGTIRGIPRAARLSVCCAAGVWRELSKGVSFRPDGQVLAGGGDIESRSLSLECFD